MPELSVDEIEKKKKHMHQVCSLQYSFSWRLEKDSVCFRDFNNKGVENLKETIANQNLPQNEFRR